MYIKGVMLNSIKNGECKSGSHYSVNLVDFKEGEEVAILRKRKLNDGHIFLCCKITTKGKMGPTLWIPGNKIKITSLAKKKASLFNLIKGAKKLSLQKKDFINQYFGFKF